MKRKYFWAVAMMLSMGWGAELSLDAQPEPDLILFNGKVVTIDNHDVNANLGTIAQAIAIRDGKIAAVGSNADVRRLAGSNTKSLDLKGRMVTPGFGATHDHPQDWVPLNPYVVRKVINDDIHIARFLWEGSPEEKLRQFPRVLEEAVQKAKPGQWIRISLLYGRDYRGVDEITGYFGRQINKQMLDLAAPNNPVIVRAGFTGVIVNQMAIEVVNAYYGDQLKEFRYTPLQRQNLQIEQTGTCGTCYRQIDQDVVYPPAILAEMFHLELSWMTGYGQTLTASALYTSGALRAYRTVDRRGQMPMRFAWAWFWPYRNDFFFDPYFREGLVTVEGSGSDHFWFFGATPEHGGGCSKLAGTSPEVKQREESERRGNGAAGCAFADPTVSRALYEYIKAGGRLAGDHQIGDGEIDLVLDIIEKASKDAGMTIDEIRAKRHVTEHMGMYPRLDQLPRLKNLGMMTSGFDINFFEGAADRVLRDYGERGVQQIQPRKSLYDAGIMNSVEIDRPLTYTDLTYFHVLYSGITKKNREGRVLAPQQAISREAMLKSATLWGAYGALREKVLGSLEPGKWADLAILDRDYLTIPIDDILKIRVLMTMVGGKMEHLVPSLAREWGMQPAGAQVELGGNPAQW